MSYCILKIMENKDGGKPIHHIILDGTSEVLEFKNKDKAEEYRSTLENNSDSGHRYVLRKIGSA